MLLKKKSFSKKILGEMDKLNQEYEKMSNENNSNYLNSQRNIVEKKESFQTNRKNRSKYFSSIRNK